MTEMPPTDHVPDELRAHDQWVCWQTEDRDGKQTKVPIDPSTGRYASTTDSTTWATFEQARDYTEQSAGIAGIGFVFTDDDPFVGVDLDDCRDEDGTSAEWAVDIIERLESYTELSPSGTGYHIIVTGELPEGANRRGDVECYETGRYFTVTGESIRDPPRDIAARSEELGVIHTEYLSPEQRHGNALPERNRQVEPTTELDDEQVLTQARTAANATKFERLWSGSTSGYKSQSEADMALCFQLAFWTGGDVGQMDRLFRQSGLMRDKWDEVHFADGSTYGEKTLERAVTRVDEFYEPSTTTSGSPPNPRERGGPPGAETAGEQSTAGMTSREHREQRLLGLLDRLEARIAVLEAENDELREELAWRRSESERREEPTEQPSDDEPSGSVSRWAWLPARFRKS